MFIDIASLSFLILLNLGEHFILFNGGNHWNILLVVEQQVTLFFPNNFFILLKFM